MKFILPSYKIISTEFNRDDVIERVASAARTCYQSEPKSAYADLELMNKLIKLGHEAMIEFAPDLHVVFTTCRGVTHELVRHRLTSFAQESTRYVKYGKEPMEFLLPPWINDPIERNFLLNGPRGDGTWTTEDLNDDSVSGYLFMPSAILLESLIHAEQQYTSLLEYGWLPQQAREVLPNALKSEIQVKMNVRSWRNFFYLRCSKTAHPQMQELVIPLFKQLQTDIPELWDDVASRIKWA